MIFDLWFECRSKNEGEITAFFSSNFARQITLGIGPGLWTVMENEKVLELPAAAEPRIGTVRL